MFKSKYRKVFLRNGLGFNMCYCCSHSEKIMGSNALQPEMNVEWKTLPLNKDFLNQIKTKYCSRLQVNTSTSVISVKGRGAFGNAVLGTLMGVGLMWDNKKDSRAYSAN